MTDRRPFQQGAPALESIEFGGYGEPSPWRRGPLPPGSDDPGSDDHCIPDALFLSLTAAPAISMIQPPQSVHMLGICGTAMTALAGCLIEKGVRVTGTDQGVYPPMSDHLAAFGIICNEGYRAENIPLDTDLVVVGNVIRESNPEAEEMRNRGLPHLSMAEAIFRFAIGGRHTVAVVGTHGKTTTTSLAAHVLTDLGAKPGFLIGGIANNFQGNFSLGEGNLFIIEGDEYDTAYFDKTPKFFKYRPATVIFTSLEFDHGDIYPDLDAIRAHFARLIREMPGEGALIACSDDLNVAALLEEAPCQVVRYGFAEGADCRLKNWSDDGRHVRFDTVWKDREHTWLTPLPGRHNALNAAAAAILAWNMGYGPESIAASLESFRGVKRRQEVRGVVDGVTVIDDFAHHPTAVRLTLDAMRHRYPRQRLWAVLEPRSFTARGVRFQDEFAGALSGADRALISRPFFSDYSSGFEPLDTAQLAAELRSGGLWAESMDSTDEILSCLVNETREGDVVLIMSNGAFDGIHGRLLDALAAREKSHHKTV